MLEKNVLGQTIVERRIYKEFIIDIHPDGTIYALAPTGSNADIQPWPLEELLDKIDYYWKVVKGCRTIKQIERHARDSQTKSYFIYRYNNVAL